MRHPPLSPAERALLRDVRISDEDHGGLAGDELGPDEYEAMEKLCSLGLVEAIGEYGEAPDGEEDERDAGAHALAYRITGAGVLALALAEEG
ncbi:Hypothetical protein A7982_06067 [Minicystis rosea]|nr:Hypothetical protein A7982_06067 [Minicystis rosea]